MKALHDGRIERAFARGAEEGRALLVTYVMAGDPTIASSRAMAMACIEGGADVLEIGMPFSDPIADGPTLQRAAQRALKGGANVAACLELARHVRARSQAPIALMGYLNPVLSYGLRRFVVECGKSGVDAVILPDLPPEEAGELLLLARAHGVRPIFLLAPTSTPSRVERIRKLGSGFVYYTSVTGVTGARAALPEGVAPRVAELRARVGLPLAVGFGISTPAQVRELSRFADGVVVGSAIVSRVEAEGTTAERADRVRRFVRSLRRALEPSGEGASARVTTRDSGGSSAVRSRAGR